ncbi:MAG: glycosyltransferase, partial [Acidobacteriota bacterium]|nr:glycosyltransferase [Acidobacteriota bacterium]
MPAERTGIGFVVATKDRPEELGRLLRSLAGQSRPPAEVVIVDGGTPPVRDVANDPAWAGLRIRYERCLPPSAARQRNRGLAVLGPEAAWIGFLDDDAVLADGALARMADFLASSGPDLGGASFNMINAPQPFAAGLKSRPWVERFGIYSGNPGEVLPSGFQVLAGRVDRTREVHWLGSGASVWRRDVFNEFAFDEWFGGYSYLEDLDFSYRVGKRYRLAVVAGADYEHIPAAHGRGSGFAFGRREARNRIHFVRKNPELSLARCRLALGLRAGISLVMAVREAS